MMRSLSYLLLIWLLPALGFAQVIPKSLDGKSVSDLCQSLNSEGIECVYLNDSLKQLTVAIPRDSMPLNTFINTIDKDGVQLWLENGLLFVMPSGFQPELPRAILEPEMAKREESNNTRSAYLRTSKDVGVKTVVIGSRKKGAYGTHAVLRGKVVSAETGEPVVGATLYFEELKTGTSTDVDGNYQIKLKKGTYALKVQSVENRERKYKLKVYSDDRLNIEMERNVYDFGEVIVNADGNANVERAAMGIEKLDIKAVKKLPKFMGENDLVKASLLLPGVQSVGEGTGGFNVRGAPADQNIFYLNGIPVYNTSHLFGFFSAFTPNAIQSFSLYKNSFPARFGGRLSSVFDIETKEGDAKDFGLQGGINAVTADLQAEGPIVKDKLSYMVGVRSTYSNWVLKLFEVPALEGSSAGFRDGVANLSFTPNQNSKVTATGYYSYDRVNLNGLTEYRYENSGASIQWQQLISDKHRLNVSAVWANYGYEEQNSVQEFAYYALDYNIGHYETRAELTLRPNDKHEVDLGGTAVFYQLDLGSISPLGQQSLVQYQDFGAEQGLESAIYVNEKWKVSPRLSVNAGLRLNHYRYLGPNEVFSYEGDDRTLSNINDTTSYGNFESIATYTQPDVRISARYAINEFFSIKAGVNQVHQYINMLTNTVAVSPTAKWKLADAHIKPITGWQYSLGLFKNLRQNKYEASVEAYLKQIDELVAYKDGANLIVNPVPEVDVLQGELLAYGAEFMLKKVAGDLSGWINYTYARSFVQVEGINQGDRYPADFDKPHALNISANYKFSRRISLSGNAVYASGRPVTYPTAVFYQHDMPVTYYSKRNEFRIPYYLRFDLGLNIEGNLRKDKLAHGSWSFSVYNLLGRNNPFSVYAVQEAGRINGYQLSIFGSPIISVGYQFKLGSYAN